MIATLQQVHDRLRTTGKNPPLTAKLKAALEAEALSVARQAAVTAGFTVLDIEVKAMKSSSPRRPHFVSVTYLAATGTKAEHLAAAQACKDAGLSVAFAFVERGNGYTRRVIELLYPFV